MIVDDNYSRRLQYSNGQLLAVEDFRAEQEYHLERRRRHNRLAHTWGILEGLEIEEAQGGMGLVIKPGTAIDGKGREIVLLGPDSEPVKLKDSLRGTTFFLAFAYDEGDDKDMAAKDKDGKTIASSRWIERTSIQTTATAPATDGSVITLAKVTVDATGKVTTIDKSVRSRFAGLNPATDLSVRSLMVGVGVTDPKSALSVAGGLAVGANYAKTNAAPPNGLLVEGSVGIGTTNPTAELQFRDLVANSNVLICRKAAPSHNEGNVPSELALGTIDSCFAGVRIRSERKGTVDKYIGNSQYICFETHDAKASYGERMRITPEGNVGIKTNEPKSALSVGGGLTVGVTCAKTNPAPENGLLVEGRVRIGTGNRVSDAKLAIGGDSAETGFGQGTHWLQLRNDKIDTKDAKWGIAWDGGDPVNTPTAFILANFDEVNTTSLTFGTRNRVGNTAERMRVTSDGNVGIGTTDPKTRLQIGETITHRDTYNFSDSTTLLVRAKDHNGGSTPAATQSVLALVREGVAAQAYGNMVEFRLGRWENVGTSSRSQLDIYLTEDKFVPKHVMSVRANGNVGIGTTAPASKLHIDKGRVDITTSDITGGGEKRFDGLRGWNAEATYRRGQLVLSSSFSDLVIASSHDNNIHGSTLTLATYNPTDPTDYRKWVINQGNWGARKQFLDFGYSDEKGRANPHDNINGKDTVFTLDGVNKRVGIRTGTPGATLQIGETIAHRDTYNFSDSTTLLVRAKDHNGGSKPAATQSVLALVREGVGGEAYGNMVDFRLGRWEHATGYPSRTQLDIYLTEDKFVPKHVMSLRANGNVGIEGVIVQEDWKAALLQNSWQNYGGEYNPAGYFRDKQAIVHLRGLVKLGTLGEQGVIFQLPEGYRPAHRQLHAVATDYQQPPGMGYKVGTYPCDLGRCDISDNGNVIAMYATNNGWFSLDGISFRAEK
jgi:hypothetical protein